jgi:dethiobiotin synthetase
MSILVVTATGTEVGKTIVTAALASLAPHTTAVVKLGQTGVDAHGSGDIDVVRALSGCHSVYEFVRYPDPLSPHHAARIRGLPTLTRADAVGRVNDLAAKNQIVVVEGSGGALVPFDETGWTVLDLAADLDAQILLVTSASLGTLNHTALTVRAIAAAGLSLAGIVVGSWPATPGLAERCNLRDLAAMSGKGRLAGALRAGIPDVSDFSAEARTALGPELGGSFDWAAFAASYES